jgi:uncharacterized protein (TIGR02466 family)
MSEALIFPLFSTPLFVRHDLEYDTQKVVKYLESIAWKEIEAKNGKSTVNYSLLDEPEMADVRQMIEYNLKVYLFEFLDLAKHHTLRHSASWAMLHERGDYAQQHMHKNSQFSGVLYVQTPPNSGDFLIFDASDHQPTFATQTLSPDVDASNMYNSRCFRAPVNEKTICIFPSHLYHKTSVSKTDEKRYCIAFDYLLTGTYGQQAGSLTI